MIDDSDWLTNMAGGLSAWHQSLADNLQQVTVLKYEDIIARDPSVLRTVADRFGVSCSNTEIAEIYDAVLFRNLLPQVGGHFYQGGNNKWRTVFRPENLEVIRSVGMSPVFHRFGYAGLEAGHVLPSRPSAAAPNKKSRGELGRDLYIENEHCRLDLDSPIVVTTNDDRVLESMQELFGSSRFRRLIRAGGGEWFNSTAASAEGKARLAKRERERSNGSKSLQRVA